MKRNVAATPIGRHVVKVQVTGKAEGTPIKSIICSNNQKPKISSKDIQLWQKISGSEDHYVFSAFHDDRRHALRIIAMTSHRSPIQYKCQMWLKNSSSAYHSDANVYNVPETHGLRYVMRIFANEKQYSITFQSDCNIGTACQSFMVISSYQNQRPGYIFGILKNVLYHGLSTFVQIRMKGQAAIR